MTVLNLLVGIGFCLAALIFRRTRPLALLAAATGVLWFLGDVVGLLVFAHRGPVTHLLLIYPDTKLRRKTHRMIAYACYLLSSAYPLGRLDLATIALAVSIIVVSLWRPASKTMSQRIAGAGAALVWGVVGLGAISHISDIHVDAGILLAYELSLFAVTAALAIDYRYRRSRAATVTSLAIDLGQARPRSLRDVLAEALADPSLVLALPREDSKGFIDENGRSLHLGGRADRTLTDLHDRGHRIAVIEHDPALLRDPALLQSITSLVGIAIANTHLQHEVAERIADVESSRRRLLGVADAERDRLEADLQGRVQARLQVVADLVAESTDGDDLRDLVAETREVIRAFARGVHPRRLDEEGLAVAIADLAGIVPVAVELDIPSNRFPHDVEVAAYFLCAEALTNAAKYAKAARVCVSIQVAAGQLMVEVIDDGLGGAALTPDGGLMGLQDRLEVLRGTLTVDSPPQRGTTISAMIPLADHEPASGINVSEAEVGTGYATLDSRDGRGSGAGHWIIRNRKSDGTNDRGPTGRLTGW
jgi:signal transduction histidine kinase